MNGKLAHLGILLLILGGALLLTPSFGFETIAADRPADVSTAEDEHATIGFEATNDAIDNRTDAARLFWLRNNADQELTLAALHRLSIAGLLVTEDGSGTLQPGGAAPVSVECGDFGGSDTATLTTTVDSASGQTLTITDAASTVSFLADCEVPSVVWNTTADWDAGADERTVSDDVGDRESDTVRLGYDADESGLVGYWPLDEDSGSTARDAALSNDGTMSGGYTLGQRGLLNTSGFHSDSTGTIEVPDDASLQLQGDMTVSFWVRTSTLGTSTNGNNQVFFLQKSNYGVDGYEILDNGDYQIDNTDAVVFRVNEGGDTSQNYDVYFERSKLNDGQWHNVVGVRNGTAMELYLDGELQDSRTDSTLDVNTDPLSISGAPDGNGSVEGDLEEVRVYDRALSASEVQALNRTTVDGTHTTDWRSTDGALMVDDLFLQNVSTSLGGTDATVAVESDTDGDGTVDETSDPIALADDTAEYEVTGLANDTDRVRLRAEFATENVSRTPILSRAELSEKHPYFGVSIDGTNEPVVEGETLSVDVTVTNTGYDPDTQTVELRDLDGSVVDSTEIGLEVGEAQSATLAWETAAGDAGTGSVEVDSEDDSDAASATVQTPPNLTVAIDGTNSHVTAGEVLSVDATVANEGGATASQNVTLSTAGVERDSRSVTLAGGASVSITLEWATTGDDVGIYDAAVASEDDADATEVSVVHPDGPTWKTDGDWSDGAVRNRTVSDDVGDRESDTVRLGYDADTSGLVGYWPFDEDSGSTATDVVGGNHGDHAGGGIALGNPGLLNTSRYQFDGNSQVNVSDDPSLQLDGDFTVSVWIRADGTLGTSDDDNQMNEVFFVDKGNWDGGHGYQLIDNGDHVDTAGTEIKFRVHDGTDHSEVTLPRSDVNDGSWHQLTGVREGGEIRLYLDGESRGSQSGTSVATSTDDLYVGGSEINDRHHDGDVDELRIYDRALSAGEVQDLYETTDRGNHTTDWLPTGEPLDTAHLQLENVSAATGAQNATVYVESDTDHDGTVDETSDPVALTGTDTKFDVTGLTTDPDRVRLRVEFDTMDVTRTPIVSRVTLDEKANFDVVIDDTNEPVQVGDTLTVDATVTNDGEHERTKAVALDVDGTERDSQSLTLGPSESASVSLEWQTSDGDVGYHDATVATDDDGETVEVGVYDPDGQTWATDTDWSRGATADRTVSDDVGDRENDTVRLGYDAEDSDLVGYWPLDEDGGSTAVDTTGSYDGVHNGSLSVGERGLLNTTGYGFSHEGRVAVANDTPTIDGDMAVSLWLRTSQFGTNPTHDQDQAVLFHQGDYDNFRGFGILDDGEHHANVMFRVMGGGQRYTVTVPRSTLNDGVWHHLVAVRDGGDISLYVDGEHQSTTGQTQLDAFDGELAIGSYSGGQAKYAGDLEEVRLYDGSLSDAEIRSLYDTTAIGNHTTEWRPTGGALNASELQLENVSVATGGQNATAYVESDTDHDGAVDETSDAIALSGDAQQYDVGGLTTHPDRVRLRVEFETDDLYRTPVVSRIELSEKRPTFDVAIDGTNSPVTEGEALTVNATVTNLDDRSDTQTIELRDVDGTVVDATEVSLGASETNGSVTLTWATEGGDEGTGDVTVASPDRSAAEAVTIEDGSQFDVTIDDANDPVVEGEPLTVNATVTNSGTVTDTETVALEAFDGTVVDQVDVTLAPDESNGSVALTWQTQKGDAGSGDVSVDSSDGVATRQVTVEQAATFDVAIDGTNGPVMEGEDLAVDVNVTNTGDVAGTQTVELADFDGTVVDAVGVSLGAGETNGSITLTWATQDGDGGNDTLTVSSEDDSATEQVHVQQPAHFAVAIDDTNATVTEGETLTVNATVTNEGDYVGTQTIALADFDGTVVDSVDVSLAAGESNGSIVLEWATVEGDAGSGDVAVSSENESATQSVTVEQAGPVKVTNVAPNVSSGEDTQYFEFELQDGWSGDHVIEINVSDADNSAEMSYDDAPTVDVENGSEHVTSTEWVDYADNDLTGVRVTLDSPTAGEYITVSTDGFTTTDSGGPWTVTFEHDDGTIDWLETDDFEIDGTN